MTHKCPIGSCQVQVRDSQLMCLAHWRMVPNAFKVAVYAEYRKAPQSETHMRVCGLATKAVEERLKLAGEAGRRRLQ